MVREVCERIEGDKVAVLPDQWHLREGDDVYRFMERCVKDPTVTAVLSGNIGPLKLNYRI
jgi:hypothetical protein